jgi:vancomycin resistance protein YoaR
LRALRRGWKPVLWAVAATLAGLMAAGVLFAGSPERIPAGVTLAGVNVGGLTAAEAERTLSARAAALADVPVVFTAGERRYPLTARELEVRVDWRAAVAEALDAGDAPMPFRGLKRVQLRLFGSDLRPHADSYEAGLRFRLRQMARRIDVAPRDAALVLRGLAPVVVPAEAGRRLDGAEAEETIVSALAGLERQRVALPVAVDPPAVEASDLEAAAGHVRTALSAPVGFTYKGTRWRLNPAQLARLLELPADGAAELRIGGPDARSYFENIARGVAKRARSADFRILAGGAVEVVPGADGRALDIGATAEALLAAALSTTRRQAELVVRALEPRLTTAEARALRITRVLAVYGSPYSGTADRIRNLQLATAALDGTLVRPGATFSFNKVVGPRTKERGYGPAPVIMGGEYKDGIGGGVSQVATTVFNAAWEAGLRITTRTAHALYISRYPLGRDATVNYPNVDLGFVNDTKKTIYVQAAYDDGGISIALLGGKTNRRVVSVAGELREIAPPKEKLVPDPNLFEGERLVEDAGEPARAVTVTRTIYVGDQILRRETWNTTYRSEPTIVRAGTLAKPEEKTPKATTTTKTTTSTKTMTTPTTGD